ncbi:hypothetical protein SAMN02799641_01786 [Rhodococcus erythropolis]|uniref:hypothetical protein n=1 Tax=Rhodococcus erythropolis TaxID=1833 RepID=UPI000875FA0D|nr:MULTISPECIES: hypothetical protein [Rhodococcus erythropolis group]SCY41983.1 hypothetical protein SAMN02799641_01786 [Rhodococcus erythropolis]
MNANMKAAARLLLQDEGRRSADQPEVAETYAAKVDAIVAEAATGDGLDALLRALLDLFAATDSLENRRATIARCQALAYLDVDILEDQVRGRRPGAGGDL